MLRKIIDKIKIINFNNSFPCDRFVLMENIGSNKTKHEFVKQGKYFLKRALFNSRLQLLGPEGSRCRLA